MRKTKLTFLLLVVALAIAIMPTNVFALSGAGTELDPFIISNEADLLLVKNNLSAYYKLGDNVSLTAAWSPIGDATEPFSGVFDGAGFTVSGLNITVSSGDAMAGLFGYSTGDIKNLAVTMGTGMEVTATESAYAGAIVAYNLGGTITNCSVEGTITVTASTTENKSNIYVGMIAGYSTGDVLDSVASGSVTATVSSASGNKTAANPVQVYAGGFIGLSEGNQERNFSSVNVQATSTSPTEYSSPKVYAGGISGENSGNIIYTYATGSVTATANSTTLEAAAYAGGLFGKNSGTIDKSYAEGNVTAKTSASSAKTYAGGLIGYSTGSVSESYAKGTVNAEATTLQDTVYAGGLVGLSGGRISECYAIGEATVTASNAVKGGLVGYTAVTADNSYYKNSSSYTVLSGCGTAKTEDELKLASTYSGWDFDNVWGISAGQNDGYPYIGEFVDVDITLQDAEYTYDGTEKTLTASNVGEGVTVEYSNNKATDAGEYDVVATVTAQGRLPFELTAKLTIHKKEVTVSGIVANNKEYDNTTAATLDFTNAEISGVIEGDEVVIDTENTVANFVSKGIGENIGVEIPEVKFTGADGGNYTTAPYMLTANILEGDYENVVFEGSGTEADPYIIFDEHELNAIRGNLSAHYRLANNINLTGEWIPIGRASDKFTGTFDGSDYTISGINVNPSINYTYSGLFGYNDGTIKNLNITVNNNIYTTSNESYIGAIAGLNEGTITNCTAVGSITTNPVATFVYIGGIAGFNNGTISGCEANVNIEAKGATAYVGGMVGENKKVIELSAATGNITATDVLFAYAGGFAGNNTGTITNCYSKGDVTISVSDIAFMANAGGFAGRVEKGSISYAYSTGEPVITVAPGAHLLLQQAGGFTSYNAGTLSNCLYDTESSGKTDTDKGTPKTTAALKSETAIAGWNADIWGILAIRNDGYPFIKTLVDTMDDVQLSYSDRIITVDSNVNVDSATLIAASYSSGTLTDIDIIEPLSVNAGQSVTKTVKEDFVVVSGGKVKIMLWENMEDIKPICKFAEISID